MSSYSGLNRKQRIRARDLAVRAAYVGLKNQATLQYTQGPRRWDGINNTDLAWKGQCPRYADCSAFATWCLWNALGRHFQLSDRVNGANWKAGYTGTLISHGKRVRSLARKNRGDLVLYGDPFGRTGHVAIYIGGGKVISFGGEPGPRLLPWNYRPVTQVRRYI
jgi:cell wall-associated NlpC family hydrolase